MVHTLVHHLYIHSLTIWTLLVNQFDVSLAIIRQSLVIGTFNRSPSSHSFMHQHKLTIGNSVANHCHSFTTHTIRFVEFFFHQPRTRLVFSPDWGSLYYPNGRFVEFFFINLARGWCFLQIWDHYSIPTDHFTRPLVNHWDITRQPLVHSRFTRYHASNIGILNQSPSSKSFTRKHALTIENSVVNSRYTHSRVNHRGSPWYIRWWQIR